VRATAWKHRKIALCWDTCDISLATNISAATTIGSHCSRKWFPISILAILWTCQLRDLRCCDVPVTSPSRGRCASRITADMCMTRFACRAVTLVNTSIGKDSPRGSFSSWLSSKGSMALGRAWNQKVQVVQRTDHLSQVTKCDPADSGPGSWKRDSKGIKWWWTSRRELARQQRHSSYDCMVNSTPS